MEQISIFSGAIPFKVDKPIRLIELFAGIGAQAKALERMGVEFEHYKISEWEVNATASYKAIHKEYDNTDYSAEFTNEELAEILFNIGISTDGKKAAPLKYIKSKSEQWKRTVFNDFKATNNVGSILNIKGNDLAIVDTDTYCYIMTYSFPCQDLSVAGKQMGMEKGSSTRSGLLWEVERLLDECTELPQVLLMENVTQVHGKKNADSFRQWCDKLESLGYKNYWEDLNAKDFGVPQSRNRTFMVSVLGDYTYEFPEGFPLEIRLKDVLEDEVDEKYYLSGKMFNYAFNMIKEAKGIGFSDGVDSSFISPDVANTLSVSSLGGRSQRSGTSTYVAQNLEHPLKVEDMKRMKQTISFGLKIPPHSIDVGMCLTSRYHKGFSNYNPENAVIEPAVRQIANLMPSKTRDNPNQGRLYDKEGLCPTLGAMQGGNRQPFITEEPIIIDEQNQYIRKDGCVGTLTTDGSSPKHNNRIIEVWDGFNQRVRADSSTVGTLTHNCGADLKRNGQGIISYEQGLRIRKLTPKECFRLMGFDDADFEKAEAVNSNTQLYKQAGNSIVVDVLMAIFSKLF